ncbi:MAG: methyltransferase domain-containing protein, partial [Planctomycetota bacterium]
MAEKAVNSLLRYKRFLYLDTPVYINPDEPDWFIPTARADSILEKLLRGETLCQTADSDSSTYGIKIEQSIFLIKRLIGRLDKKPTPAYAGRSNFLSLDRLKECWFHITNNCNLSCKHCMFSSRPGCREELSRDELLSAVNQVKELGCKIFYFTGGEPFVYGGFTDICDYIFENEDSHIVVLSNAILIEKFENRLNNTDKNRLHFQISLDGLRQHHDTLRGQGTFDETINNIRLLKDIGCNVSLAMAVTKNNVSDMTAVVELAASLNVRNIHFLWLFKKGQEKGDNLVSAEHISRQLSKVKHVADAKGVLIDNIEIIKSQIFSLPGTKYDLSNSCWQSLAIGPDGGIYPSPALIGEERLKAGHLSQTIEKVWRDSEICNMVRKASLIDSNKYSENPLKFLIGGGDIDHSYINSGRLTGADPYVDIYNNTAFQLLIGQVDITECSNQIAFLARMGERLYQCGEDMGEVVCTHSNCVLSLPGKDGHTLIKAFYTKAVEKPDKEICNSANYDEKEISHVPVESRIRNYGCGSPVLDCDLKAGQVLVDFGSGTGIECFIAAKKVGPTGKVIGVDMADAMLAVAEKSKIEVVKNLRFNNIEFKKAFFEQTPVESNSADVVISNCVINLSPDKRKAFSEIFRILKPGGKTVISDICYEDEIPLYIKYNQKLRGACLGGAFKQDELFALLGDLDFEAVRILKRFLYKEIVDYKFYAITYSAAKPSETKKTKVIYRGPFSALVTKQGQIINCGVTTEISLGFDLPSDEAVFVIDKTDKMTDAKQPATCSCSTLCCSESTKEKTKTISQVFSNRFNISVIIPVLNEYDQINSTIVKLRQQGFKGVHQIIVVDGDRLCSTINVIEDKDVVAITSKKGRGCQINAGAKIARGDVILFLHADTILPDGAIEKISQVLENEEYVGGAFNLGIDSNRLFLKFIAVRASLRSRLNRIPYGDQAI